MKKYKVLNLYASLGGNRLEWKDCEVTAVELDPELARMYQERFPNDKVIVGDAKEHLLKSYSSYDFIWLSPPCPSHSRARFWSSKGGKYDVIYPDFSLYEQIVFLQNFADDTTKWVVENVIPYYEPLIPTISIGRHLYWSNFRIPQPSKLRKVKVCQGVNEVDNLCEFHKLDMDFFNSYKGTQNRNKLARNLVDYEVGKHIFDIARGIYQANNTNQTELF